MANKKYYDLTTSQNLMYYALKFSPKKNIMNIGASLWFKEDVDIDLLKKAILISLNRIDALRIHLTKVDGEVKQYLNDEKYEDIEVLDYSEKTKEEIVQEFTKRAHVEMKWKDCDLIDIVLAKLPEDHVAICIVVNHVICDAWGLTVFMKDALDIYTALKQNKALPEKPQPFLELLEKEAAYDNSEKMKEDEEYWKNVFSSAPSYCAISRRNVGKRYKGPSLDVTSRDKTIILPKEKVDKINNYCRENRFSPQVIFLLSLFCYLSMFNNKEDAVIETALSRRSSIEVKKASGMFINALAIYIKCPRSMTFMEACEEVSEVQFGAFKHGDYPFGNVNSYIQNKYAGGLLSRLTSFMDVTFTYQLGKVKTNAPLDFDVMYHSNGASLTSVYLTIMDIADRGSLQFNYDYQIKAFEEEDIDIIHNYMMKVVETGISNPEMTLQQIIEDAEKSVFKKVLFTDKQE